MIVKKAGRLSGINVELSFMLSILNGPTSTLGARLQRGNPLHTLLNPDSRDKYLIASTYLSTRAFPSTLLSRAPTLLTNSSTYPIMFPGVDILNHSRGQPVSWCTSYPEASTQERDDFATVSIISHTTTLPGEEVFNNYGLKANDELILGYGFSLPQNPDDKITLQLGGSPNKWVIGRHASGAEGLWNEVRELVAEDTEEVGYEEDLEAAQVLLEMVQKKYDLLPQFPREDAAIRPAVRLMLEHYLEGLSLGDPFRGFLKSFARAT
jgi:hypothetical protein